MDDFLDEMDDFEHTEHYMYEDPGYADHPPFRSVSPEPLETKQNQTYTTTLSQTPQANPNTASHSGIHPNKPNHGVVLFGVCLAGAWHALRALFNKN
jgi:hypothetical protein